MFKMRVIASALAFAAFAIAPAAHAQWSFGNGKQLDDEANVFAADKPMALQPFYRQLYRDGEWNAVLNFDLLGLAAMQQGYHDIARKAFDQAIARIDVIYADDANAKQALSVFSEEKVKDFKGEPYERAMTYFYRGVLYLQEGDYQNARAAFLAADLQGTMAETETFAGDFGLMKYLAGWASICDGDASRGKALIEEAKKSDAKIADLPDQPGTAMLLIDSGLAPRKVARGKYKELMAFESGGVADGDIVVKGQNGSLEIKEFSVGGDVYLQASTRGGRQIDAVLNSKAQFKGDSDVVGDTAIDVGTAVMAASNDRATGVVGAVIGLFGLIAKGVAYATTPAADLRQWTSLPANVMLFTGNLQPGQRIAVSSAANPIETLLPVQAGMGSCWIGWGRTRSALTVGSGGTAQLPNIKPEEGNREQKNTTFRGGLKTDFVYAAAPAVAVPPGLPTASMSAPASLTAAVESSSNAAIMPIVPQDPAAVPPRAPKKEQADAE